ncbi:hypothetical protein [Salibaculum griseiflavum]|jgi:hypothetical protein|uniref:Uncharacterized protein n=1 Tax=Salibaculum griseiflavum TaxID=1914409 RepID=A0A2V1P7W3_9RHOB|nr:hypothetical protein [Salibaculum griseiflavum]PWG17898.1 hypothetical protein DFK10_04075 [Salibaculum griseiflavum]
MSIDTGFDKRVDRIVRTHDRIRRNGVVHRVGKDGLIVTRPRVARPRFPLRGVLVVVLLGFAFKGLLWAQIGAAGYNDRVERLRQGTVIEKAGAWLLQEDAVTIWIGQQTRPYLRR